MIVGSCADSQKVASKKESQTRKSAIDSTAANLVKTALRFLTADHQSPLFSASAFQLLIGFLLSAFSISAFEME